MSPSKSTDLQLRILALSNGIEKGVPVYQLFKEVKVPLSEFMSTVIFLQGAGHVTYDNDRVTITEQGSVYLLETKPERKSAKIRIPPQMIRHMSIDPMAPFIPSKSRLDKDLLKKRSK